MEGTAGPAQLIPMPKCESILPISFVQSFRNQKPLIITEVCPAFFVSNRESSQIDGFQMACDEALEQRVPQV